MVSRSFDRKRGFHGSEGVWPPKMCIRARITDSAKTSETPQNAAEFMEFVKAHPGRVTYPALPDFTGRTFVVNLIYDIVGYEQFQTMEADKETVREAIEPAIEYLKELNPYLWNEGKTFPATIAQVDTMFADGELDFTMSCYPYTCLLYTSRCV